MDTHLYYRLNVFPLHWPRLCERQNDIIPLAKYLLSKHAAVMQRCVPKLDESAIQILIAHNWPGNIRELDNVLHRALILQTKEELTGDDIYFLIQKQSDNETSMKMTNHSRNNVSSEFQHILDTLNSLAGNRKEVALKLGISERALRYKLAKMRCSGVNV